MIKKEGMIIRVFMLLFFTLILSISSISTLGVANSYWDEKPLKLAPGESITISLRLQNEGDDVITIEVSLDSEIASLVEGIRYDVPPGKVSVPVYIKVEIPEDAEIGKKYTLLASFKQVSLGDGEGFFQVAQGITSKVPIEVVGEQESEIFGESSEKKLNIPYLISIILILAVIGLAFFFKKRKTKK